MGLAFDRMAFVRNQRRCIWKLDVCYESLFFSLSFAWSLSWGLFVFVFVPLLLLLLADLFVYCVVCYTCTLRPSIISFVYLERIRLVCVYYYVEPMISILFSSLLFFSFSFSFLGLCVCVRVCACACEVVRTTETRALVVTERGYRGQLFECCSVA